MAFGYQQQPEESKSPCFKKVLIFYSDCIWCRYFNTDYFNDAQMVKLYNNIRDQHVN